MKKRFSYLSHAKAIEEIHKHKWIESEKKGEEIGFATAAIDWINRFGPLWKKHHFPEDQN